MTGYFIGIIAAFAEPIFHGWANILDNYFSNKLFTRLTPLVFLTTLFGVLLLPIIWIIDRPSWITPESAVILFAISLIEIFYLYPYYWSLRHTDTSIVASLFSMGQFFVPILAFFLVGERLTGFQYLGFLMLTVSSVLLALNVRKMKLNKAFVLMLVVSAMLAVQSVLLKYVYEHGVGWGTSIVWMTFFELIITGVFTLAPKNLAEIRTAITKIRSIGPLIIGMEILSWGGSLGGSYALFLIPVSVAKGIASAQPIFVLLYAIIFVKLWPNIFREYLGSDGVAKKVVLFLLAIVGISLITGQ